MRLLIGIFIFFCLSESKAQQNHYIDHPDSKDTFCIKELARAKKDFAEGKLRFCYGYAWDYSAHTRMTSELDSLCKLHGTIFTQDSGLERDVQMLNDPNTYTCYSDFMDRQVAIRFGADFKQKLIKQADSIFIAKSLTDTLDESSCDTPPRSFTGWEGEFFSQFLFPDNCPIETNCQNCEIRVDFVIDTLGHASNFKFTFSKKFPLNNSCKKVYQDAILRAFDLVCDNKCWIPGILANRKVTSTITYLIDLINDKIR